MEGFQYILTVKEKWDVPAERSLSHSIRCIKHLEGFFWAAPSNGQVEAGGFTEMFWCSSRLPCFDFDLCNTVNVFLVLCSKAI